nr:integrase, catalytic region, zinc finger, CCHC-type, peptidase aspartic, catalytic [Tanacetum cinerariifolium]
MLKVYVEPIAPRLLNNRTVHSDYLKLTQEQAAILREVVEQGKSQNPLNNSLDHACKYIKRIQELLILIKQTCPSINNSSHKLVDVTPMNNDKRVGFTEPVTSSGNTNTKTASSSNLVSNKPMVSSTRLKPSTSASGSQPSGNTKKNKIQRPPKSKSAKKPLKRKVVQIVLWYLDSGCSKHMTGDLSQLTNFVNKFLGTVKFSNDHVAKIMGYGDYKIGNVTISRVGIFHETSVARSPQQNGVVERRNRTLIEVARTMLMHKLYYFYGKRKWLPHVTPKIVPFENLGKLQPKADIGIFIGDAPIKKAF